MSYSISVKFKTQAESDRMLKFLNSKEIDVLIEKAYKECNFHPSDLNGVKRNWSSSKDVNIPYGVKGSSTMLFINQSMINIGNWEVAIWLGIKSLSKDKEGDSFIYYDSEKIKLMPIEKYNESDILKRQGLILKDNKLYKEKPTIKKMGIFGYLLDKKKYKNHLIFQKYITIIDKKYEEYCISNPIVEKGLSKVPEPKKLK